MKNEIVCGINTVVELLRAHRRRCFEIYIASGKKIERLKEIETLAKDRGIKVNLTSREYITSLCHVEKNQGVAAKVEEFRYTPLNDIVALIEQKDDGAILLMLDGIVDPQNLGALIRTASLTGVAGIVLPQHNSALIGPAASRASSGAVEHIPIALETNLTRAIDFLKEKNFWIVGAAMTGTSLYSFDFKKGNFLVIMGSEGKGMKRLVKENCDHLISIPMQGHLGSFNVSVAGGIIMSEIRRQRNADFSGANDFDKIIHDLKAPLFSIKEGVALFVEDVAGKLSKDECEFLEVAQRNVEKLSELVTNLQKTRKSK